MPCPYKTLTIALVAPHPFLNYCNLSAIASANFFGNSRHLRPLGRVDRADGSITENVTSVNIKRKLDGNRKYAYPVVYNYTFKRREDE